MNYDKALCWSGRNTVFMNTISRGERPPRPRLNEALDLPRSGFKLMSGFVSLHYACNNADSSYDLLSTIIIIHQAVNLRGRGRSPEAN